MKRSNTKMEMICHWCKQTILTTNKKTTPAFSDWPSLPTGTTVVVCGNRCPKRPTGAPVGTRLLGLEAG